MNNSNDALLAYQQPERAPMLYDSQAFHRSRENQDENFAWHLTLGGMIGLTAAAALRWLNGEDFNLLPGAGILSGLQNASSTDDPRTTASGENDTIDNQRISEDDEIISDNGSTMMRGTVDPAGVPRSGVPSSSSIHQINEGNHIHSTTRSCTNQEDDRALVSEKFLEAQLDMLKTTIREENQVQSTRLRQMLQDTVSSSISAQHTNAFLEQRFEQLLKLKEDLNEICVEIKTRPLLQDNWEARLEKTLDHIDECTKDISKRIKTNSGVSNGAAASDDFFDTHSTEGSSHDKANENRKALRSAIEMLVKNNESVGNNKVRVGCQLLYLYAVNVATHPRVPRYRKIFTSNESFQKVSTLKGGKELLLAVGFEENNNTLEWLPTNDGAKHDDEDIYMTRLEEAISALAVLKQPVSSDKDSSGEELLTSALKASGLDDAALGDSLAPPPSPPAGPLVSGEDGHSENLRTPQIGSILSPPITKKYPILTPPTTGFKYSTEDSGAPSPITSENANHTQGSQSQSVSYDEITYYSEGEVHGEAVVTACKKNEGMSSKNPMAEYQTDGSFLDHEGDGTDAVWK